MKRLILFALLAWGTTWSHGQEILRDWHFHPNYTLPRNAENYPGNKIPQPTSRFQLFQEAKPPLYLTGHKPSERIIGLGSIQDNESFTVELWILNHVNLPVGVTICQRAKEKESPVWSLSAIEDRTIFQMNDEEHIIQCDAQTGWKKYWMHLVGVYSNETMQLYYNGKKVGELYCPAPNPSSEQYLEVAGYFDREPAMKIENLLKSARIYDGPLEGTKIKTRFDALKQMVEAGRFHDEIFHYNAGPYLNYVTERSINLLWETSSLATSTVRYGATLPLSDSISIDTAAYINECTLEGLTPNTPYYYEIISTNYDGQTLHSGKLSFSTASSIKDPFSFCIIGDTESRPHINNQLGQMIWEERPNFVMHLGDLTDGGKEPHKFEWNYEYFTGVTPLASRIPFFPVPGNGESDLFWYERYHRLPEPEAYYKFSYGNTDFFMLNSNVREELMEGGLQYNWLKEQLNSSSATWKVVAHHHCPVSSDENDFGNTWEGEKSTQGDPRFDDLKKLYQEKGVDAVFYGHVHAYERSHPLVDGTVDEKNGVVYIMSGGGGGHLEDFAPTSYSFASKIQRGNHFCRVSILNSTFTLKMYDLNGVLKDFFEIKK